MNRRPKLEKALAPSLPNDTIRFADMAWGIQCHADRLATLHAVLLEAVEALEILNSQLRPIGRYSDQAESALAKIDEVLKLFDSKDGEHNERG